MSLRDLVEDEFDLDSDESEPFSSSEDEDYEPAEFESSSDEYCSDDEAADFYDQSTREEVAKHPETSYLSKDKKIQFSKYPPPAAGRLPAHAVLRVQPGPTLFATSRVIDPLTAMLLFLEPIEDIVLRMTNLYGAQRYKENWRNLDIETLRAYFGLLLLAGVYRSFGECFTELWDDHHGRPIFAATMSLKQFKMIHRCLRFDDKGDRTERRSRDKLAAVREVFDKWVYRLKMLYNPGHCVTVDEQLIPFRGRCPFRQYIPNKPYRYGIKLWIVCDSETAYAYNMEIYTGRDRNCHPEVKQGQRVVLQLTEGLEGRNVTCDNFFTSHELAIELKKRKMSIVGTIRKNRKEIPPVLVDMKKKPIHHSEFVFDLQNKITMVSYVPAKGRYVTLLSSYHTRKEVSVDEHKKPEIILFYNATKGGVDLLDKVVGTYRCKRKINRWPMAIFMNMLDISAYNAFVIFRQLHPNWNRNKQNFRRRLFLIELGESLVESCILNRARLPQGTHAASLVRTMRGEQQEKTATNRLEHTERTNKRARCHMCKPKPSANLHSARCDRCKKPVCPQHRFTICEKCEEELLNH